MRNEIPDASSLSEIENGRDLGSLQGVLCAVEVMVPSESCGYAEATCDILKI